MGMRKNRPFLAGLMTGCLAAFLVPAFIVLAASLVALYVPALNQMVLETAGQRLKAPTLPETQRADYAWEVEDREGNTLSLETFEGETLFLHFWQADCTTCLAELPSTIALHAMVETRGINMKFLSVALGRTVNLDTVLESYKPPFTVYTYAGIPPAPFNVIDTPATFIVSPGGEVLLRRIGGSKWDHPSVLDYLERITVAPATGEEY